MMKQDAAYQVVPNYVLKTDDERRMIRAVAGRAASRLVSALSVTLRTMCCQDIILSRKGK